MPVELARETKLARNDTALFEPDCEFEIAGKNSATHLPNVEKSRTVGAFHSFHSGGNTLCLGCDEHVNTHIDIEDVDYNIFVLQLIIYKKYGVRSDDLQQALNEIKWRVPRRTHRSFQSLVELKQRLGRGRTCSDIETQEFESLTDRMVNDLLYYSPDEVRSRNISRGLRMALSQFVIAAMAFAGILLSQGLL